MRVNFVNYGEDYLAYQKETDNEIQRVLAAGDLILRQDVEDFENSMAEYLGVKHFIGVSNGTDALRLSYQALGIGPGDEVITVSNTFKATITTIADVGATPVLADINDKYVMNVDEVNKLITGKTKAIVPVHLSGEVVDMNALMDLADRKNLLVIEDAAQALGARQTVLHVDKGDIVGQSEMAGSIGDAGTFSFYPAKILSCAGDSGGVSTNRSDIAEYVRGARNHFKEGKGWGGNYRMDNLQAAILNVRLTYLKANLENRRETARIYDDNLLQLENVMTPSRENGRVYQDYIIRVEARDELAEVLKGADIETMIPPTLPHQELKIKAKLPKSEKYNKQYLRLPCNQWTTVEQAEYVTNQIKNFYE